MAQSIGTERVGELVCQVQRLQSEREAIARTLGVVNDDSLNLPALVASLASRAELRGKLLLQLKDQALNTVQAVEVML